MSKMTGSLLIVILFSTKAVFGQTTIKDSDLHTWWHNNYEVNSTTPVADSNVRRSAFYEVRVSKSAYPGEFYDAYTYMSIPRGGRDKWGYDHDDGAEFSDSANLSMTWSSFLYSTDVWVEVSVLHGVYLESVDEVTVRPTTLNFEKQLIDSNTVKIRVPQSAKGYRFSVEFDDDLYTAYNDMSGTTGKLTTSAEGNREIHTEPRNALLVFAEPMPPAEMVPSTSDGSTYFPAEGEVANLDNISEQIIYFRPGTYYMPWYYHAQLPRQVKWVYLAPGAHVKGAFQFSEDKQMHFKVTGYGVLSGEKYVYEADTANGYMHRDDASANCHGTCVKLLQFSSPTKPQNLDLHGITISEPPYHSFVVYGNEDRFQMQVGHYKQVGSWYWQTDGIELYSNSQMNNTFFHANDDVLKLYHSNITIDNTTIWKNENGPVIQWGWSPRNMQDVVVTNTDVIHNRMYWKDLKTNTCVINSSSHWQDPGSTRLADPDSWTMNLFFDNIRVEGKVNCAMRIYALSSTENVHVKNLHIEEWNHLDVESQASHFKRHSNADGEYVAIGNELYDGRGLKLENYRVGGEYISRYNGNWEASQKGRLDFDVELYDHWNAWQSAP